MLTQHCRSSNCYFVNPAFGIGGGVRFRRPHGSDANRIAGVPVGHLGIVAIVTESAALALALSDFCGPVPRLAAMSWGGEDLAGDLGIVDGDWVDTRICG